MEKLLKLNGNSNYLFLLGAFSEVMQTMKKNHYCYMQRAFTLIEMLVVIAIISILASVLMPAVQNSLKAARQLSCLNNQKQIALSIEIYQGTFRLYPDFYVQTPFASEGVNGCWVRKLIDLGISQAKSNAFGAQYPSEFFCPSEKPQASYASLGFTYEPYLNYAFNGRYDTSDASSRMRGGISLRSSAQINKPSQTAMLTDCTNHNWRMDSLNAIDFRHNDSANTVFVDGHGEAVKFPGPPIGYNGVFFWGYYLGRYGSGYSLWF